jgi:hypothetical protein
VAIKAPPFYFGVFAALARASYATLRAVLALALLLHAAACADAQCGSEL